MKRETERRKEERERERVFQNLLPQIKLISIRKENWVLTCHEMDRKERQLELLMKWIAWDHFTCHEIPTVLEIYIYIFPFSVIGKTCEIGLWSWVVFFGVLAAKLSRIALFVIHAFAFNWSLTPTEVFLKETLRCM